MEEPIIFPLPDHSHYLEYIFLAVVARLQFYQKQVEDSSDDHGTQNTVIILSNLECPVL